MYSEKKNILQLVALLKAHGINQAILCPGSRNSPIVQTLANHPFFSCHAVTDERSAGFFGIGLSLQSNRPVVVCCTSGTALLNLHPAVAEAFYRQIPLIIVSADRPAAWIGQTDGQTIPQPEVFRSLVKKSVHLPEIQNEEDEWYCNRLINEALLESDHHGKGPVHINIPVSEPLFRLSVEKLPDVRVIKRQDRITLPDTLNRRMLVVGQMPANCPLDAATGEALSKRFALFAEHTGNLNSFVPAILNMDTLLSVLPEERQKELRPDLLITYGGNIVSKRLKQFLRTYPPQIHWHVSEGGEIIDLFGALTTAIEAEPYSFLQKMAALPVTPTTYPLQWKTLSDKIPDPKLPYSEPAVIGDLLKKLPPASVLHLGNSSPLRYAQLFSIPNDIDVFCNRGTSGIEGSLSAAVGYASTSDKLNFVIIGDLSFFFDMNALWNGSVGNNLRILLLNNGGGEIFQTLPGLEMTDRTRRFVAGTHTASAKGWAVERGFHYFAIHNNDEWNEALPVFTQPKPTTRPLLLEVFTEQSEDIRLLNEYYKSLKKL
ncbi:MAG: 2-succinyl-5-enolpyruvyl-6-hydroxy-3-cyclohexene-1-carboxylic-acid synthase [Candidatus Azobacteroides sp.]|nr:2-succinyl-5-enolpyruvyl-6-hydroxy-3-cyclohexene-1-carboxylic-acid synthase [Candidatus Azobacteroides sp.]